MPPQSRKAAVLDPTATTDPPGAGLEKRLTGVGNRLGASLTALLDRVPGGPHGPQSLAQALGIDKVLTSRVLKAARNQDPLAVVHLVPGPEPLRRLVRAIDRLGVDDSLVTDARGAVDEFETVIRTETGDRSSLDAILSAWLPEARREFELRRKQAAFKAMSQLKGVMADANLATVLLHPAASGEKIDVIWLFGLLGVQRLRPRAAVKLASRRMPGADGGRRPTTLEGAPVEDLEGVRLGEFCSTPLAAMAVQRAGDSVHYTLADEGFGPRSAADLVFAEANFEEMPRYVPVDSGRRGYVFAEVSLPVKTLHFDVLIHEDIYPGREPQLSIYDTVLEGVADLNDRSRDIDRMDLAESVQSLGRGITAFRTSEIGAYMAMLRYVFGALQWDDAAFRGYRCRIDYPVYGSQVAMAFDPPTR